VSGAVSTMKMKAGLEVLQLVEKTGSDLVQRHKHTLGGLRRCITCTSIVLFYSVKLVIMLFLMHHKFLVDNDLCVDC